MSRLLFRGGLMSFCIAFGSALGQLGEEGRALMRFVDMVEKVSMKFVAYSLTILPAGVFCLLMQRVLELPDLVDTAQTLGWFAVAVMVGLAIHSLISLPALFLLLTRRNPLSFYSAMSPAIAVAFATSSSFATIPMTMRCLELYGVRRRVAGFVVPLGATLNMDGSALYEAVAAVFIAQMNDIQDTRPAPDRLCGRNSLFHRSNRWYWHASHDDHGVEFGRTPRQRHPYCTRSRLHPREKCGRLQMCLVTPSVQR